MPVREKTIKIREKKIAVSESNLRNAATRLLATRLVSVEIAYIQRELGSSATQEAVDTKVLAVRAMPWADIVQPE
jgi:hypothetical protein